MRKLIASAIAAAAILIPIGAVNAAEPNQPCTLAYGDADTIISTGPTDCIVRYASEDAAISAITAARAAGLYIWPREGFIVNDGQGFVVRASVQVDLIDVPLVVVMAPA